MKEADLYQPVADYFKGQGFEVKGEVCGCDLVAVKEEQIVIVELKTSFNVKLLYQAVRRLAITDQVYAAYAAPKARQKMSYWAMIRSLARRLFIGVIMVDGEALKVLVEPGPFSAKASKKKRQQVLNEFHGRRVSQNIGGVNRTKLQTAYLESAVHISVLLKKHRQLSAVELQKLGATDKAYGIVYNNHYRWFERAKTKGKYKLKRGAARKIAHEYPEIFNYYVQLVEQTG